MKYDLTVVILNYNGTTDTIACLKSIDEQVTDYSIRIVVLDNDSKKENYAELERYCQGRNDFNICNLDNLRVDTDNDRYLVRSPENYGFARGNNEICRRLIDESEYFLLLNNDTELEQDFFQIMLPACNRNILYDSQSKQHHDHYTYLQSFDMSLEFSFQMIHDSPLQMH